LKEQCDWTATVKVAEMRHAGNTLAKGQNLGIGTVCDNFIILRKGTEPRNQVCMPVYAGKIERAMSHCHKIPTMVVAETNQATWWEEGNSNQREVARNLREGDGDPNQRGRQCGQRRAMAMKGKGNVAYSDGKANCGPTASCSARHGRRIVMATSGGGGGD